MQSNPECCSCSCAAHPQLLQRRAPAQAYHCRRRHRRRRRSSTRNHGSGERLPSAARASHFTSMMYNSYQQILTTCLLPLLPQQPFVIVGGGRVGQALADMGSGADVLVRRGEAVSGPPGPIVICTRNDDLQAVVDATPPERRQGKFLWEQCACLTYASAVWNLHAERALSSSPPDRRASQCGWCCCCRPCVYPERHAAALAGCARPGGGHSGEGRGGAAGRGGGQSGPAGDHHVCTGQACVNTPPSQDFLPLQLRGSLPASLCHPAPCFRSWFTLLLPRRVTPPPTARQM